MFNRVEFMFDVIIVIIATIGIIVNCSAIFMFVTKKTLQNLFNFLLINLLTFDSVFLLLTVFWSTQLGKHHAHHTKVLSYFATKLLYPVTCIALTGSIYMTIVLALDRYISTNHPIAYQRLGSGSKSYALCYLIYVLPVTVFSVLFNLPVFFELDVYEKEELYHSTTEWHLNSTIIPTELRLHPYYMTYYRGYGRLFITGILPFVALLFFNIMVFKKMRQVMRFSEQSNVYKEYQLARVLIVIVLIFLISHIPRLCLNVFEAMHLEVNTSIRYYLLMSCVLMNTLFLTINSSVNVLIYGSLNEKFRSVMFCRKHNAMNTEYNLEVTDMATQMMELPPHVQED
jgi:hypothetical protein